VRLYRIVRGDPPTAADFESDRARGRARPVDPTMEALWDSFSAFDTEDRARRKAQDFPVLGTWIAELELREGGPIRWERTTKARGHYTVWGRPAAVCRRVVRVVGV
jgi:hypothetical protein